MVQFCSVAQSCLTLCDPKDYSDPKSLGSRTAVCQASLSITNSQSLLKLISFELVMPSNHLILSRPLLLLPSIFPSIRVFSNESVLHIRWPKCWKKSYDQPRQHFKELRHYFANKGPSSQSYGFSSSRV